MRYVEARDLKVGDEISTTGMWRRIEDITIGQSIVAVQVSVKGRSIFIEIRADAEILTRNDAQPTIPATQGRPNYVFNWGPGFNYEYRSSGPPEDPGTVRTILVDNRGVVRRAGHWRLKFEDADHSLLTILGNEVLGEKIVEEE